MKINEVEQAVGITRKNIRFYEEQGLLKPGRAANGYREYTEEDLQVLLKVKLLRKLAIPLEEIRRLQSGHLTLEDCLRRHLITLERESKNLEAMEKFCGRILSEDLTLGSLPADRLLTEMENKIYGCSEARQKNQKTRFPDCGRCGHCGDGVSPGNNPVVHPAVPDAPAGCTDHGSFSSRRHPVHPGGTERENARNRRRRIV